MTEEILLELAGILLIGVAAQWVAWRLRLPSILLLLLAGLVVGPIAEWIDPDELFGELLLPAVSLAVGVILFEGGLTLRLNELPRVGNAVRNLLVVGALVTWVVGAIAAHTIVGLDLRIAILAGAILIVTGPTVIGPLLEQIRPTGRVGPILRWEGIVIDPIGAVLAVLVFEAISGGGLQEVAEDAAVGVVKTLVVGISGGLIAGFGLAYGLRRFWIPDSLENGMTLATVLGTVAVCNEIQSECGLLAAVVMGVVLSNQKAVSVRHIVEFKENLRVILLSGLFVVLAARIDLDSLSSIGLETVAFIAALVLVARPLAVWLSTWRTDVEWNEKVFLASVAPRGIVAAAVASVFSLRLEEQGFPDGDKLLTLTFATIVGTILIYGSGAGPVARRLGLARAKPQGLLIVGAHRWAREIAGVVQREGFPVRLLDTNWRNVADGRMEGLTAQFGSAASEFDAGEMDLGGIGAMLALTPNDEVNALACQRFSEVFGRSGVYQLAPKLEGTRGSSIAKDLRGRVLWGDNATFWDIQERFNQGAKTKVTRLSDEFTVDSFFEQQGEDALPLFVITEGGNLVVLSTDAQPEAVAGDSLVSMVPAGNGEEAPD